MNPNNSRGISLEEEYKKNPEIQPQDILMLRQWVKTQPHLPEEHITELDLILVFHCCNRSFALAKTLLDLHYSLKTIFTGLFQYRKFDGSVIDTLNNILLTPLPERTSDGYVIFYTRILNTDPKVFDYEATCRALFMIIDVYQHEDGTWPGFVFVLDYEGTTAGHMARLNLTTLRQVIYYLQEAILLKIKSIHFINAPSFIDKLMLLIRPLMKKELLDLFHIHIVGSKAIEGFIPISALPKDVGGEYKSIKDCKDDVIRKLQENTNFIELENKKRINEAKRPGKQKTIGDVFDSVEGSFKKLDID